MTPPHENTIYKIGSYLLDSKSRQLSQIKGGNRYELSVAEFNILMCLLEKNELLSSQNELENAGWEGRPVSTSSLTVIITSLRKKLLDINGVSINNVPRKGYILNFKPGVIIKLNSNKSLSNKPDNEDTKLHTHKKKQLTLMIWIVSFQTLFLVFVLFIYFTFRIDFSCQNAEKGNTVCSIGDVDLSKNNGLSEVKEGDIIMITPKEIIIVDGNGNVSERSHDDK